MAAKLEDDLTCPLCCDIYKDPVIMTCAHSLCKACLQQFWESKGSRECPVCRRKSSRDGIAPNLALRNLCEAFLKERGQAFCNLHKKQFELFCEDDKQLVCQLCRDSEVHKDHNFSPTGKAAVDVKETLKDTLDPLKEKLKEFEDVKRIYVQSADQIKGQAHRMESQIEKEFEKLHQFLRDEEAARIATLREEEEQKSQMMKERIEKISREISSLSDTVRAIEEEMGADDITLLQNYKSTVERAQCTLQDPDRFSGALINVAKHLGNLKFRVWEKMQEIVQYIPVTLDPNTAHPQLILSEDLTSVRCGDERQPLPDNPERFDKYHYVLGSEGFHSGIQWWDVEVGNTTNWEVGLVAESLQRKGHIHTVSGVWGMMSRNGRYAARSKDHPYAELAVKLKLQRIRVQLDWDRGELSFSDPDNNTHLHTLTHTFTETVFPYVSGDHLRILPRQASHPSHTGHQH